MDLDIEQGQGITVSPPGHPKGELRRSAQHEGQPN
jgi:hypothetical protein